MARKIFISFRYSDGHLYKEQLEKIFDNSDYIINCSENENRANMSDDTIKSYLYRKLRDTSVTISLLTPEAINYKKDLYGNIDDWTYDEIRYSLEDRENNRSNGIIAVYTPEAKAMLIEEQNGRTIIKDFDNLVRKNMFNIKKQYKHCERINEYDTNLDHYCSLVPWASFIANPEYYIDKAIEKRNKKEQYELTVRIQNDTKYWQYSGLF